jgi:hypothetical protein
MRAVLFLVQPAWIEMSILLLLFWRVFPRDCGVHPIYRVDGIETTDERAEV